MKNVRTLSLVATVFLVGVVALPAGARELHVALTGTDTNDGRQSAPFRTINHAAQVARPGDRVIVHAGTYREWVRPARGGISDERRIVYQTAEGETVTIKGSERITKWQPEDNGLWKVKLPNTLFADYNPYALTLSGGWLLYGQWHHRGDVYLDGTALTECQTPSAVVDSKMTWCCHADDTTTTIWANFGATNPNSQLAEINVRPTVFFPEKSGLKYITVRGFHIMHSAENWEPPGLPLQMGAIGPRLGKHWIIENCTVAYARCVGIVVGHAEGVDYSDIDAFGAHIIRNNFIHNCGEAGIAGQEGAVRCLIENNLIEDTNARREFGGWETAAIKLHQSVDTVIRNNVIRRVRHQSHGAFGIWLDWANQGARVTGNVISETETEALFLEMDHGPTLVDNNVLVGGGVRSNSEASVFAHNLFVDCPFRMVSDTGRRSQYYRPHSKTEVGRKQGIPQDDKWYYNIFVRKGLDGVRPASGYAADYNLFMEGAKPSTFEGNNSKVDSRESKFELSTLAHAVQISYRTSPLAETIRGPWVDADLVGVFPTVGQTLEDAQGKPIRVMSDFAGRTRIAPHPGPAASQSDNTDRITLRRETPLPATRANLHE